MNKELMGNKVYIGSLAPVSATGATAGDYISLKNAVRCAVLVHTGVVDTSVTIQLRQAKDVSGTGVKALNFTAVNRQGGKLGITSLSGDFTVGETVTGGTSSATGIVYRNNSSELIIHTVTGTWQTGEVATGGTSSNTATTTTALTNAGIKMRVPLTAANTVALTQSNETYEIEVLLESLDVDNDFDCITADVSAEAGSGSLVAIGYLVEENYSNDPHDSLLID